MSLKSSYTTPFPEEVGVVQVEDQLNEGGAILLAAGSVLSFASLFVVGVAMSTQRGWSSGLIGPVIGLAASAAIAILGGVLLATHDGASGKFVNVTLEVG